MRPPYAEKRFLSTGRPELDGTAGFLYSAHDIKNRIMLAIKLQRVGKKKQPSFRVVVSEKHRDPWGTHVEAVGHVDPLAEPKKVTLDEERIRYWLSKGAQPTATVHNLLVDAKIIEGKKRKAHPARRRNAEEPVAPEKKPEASAA
jgi:small subunit ribosomal protein S16